MIANGAHGRVIGEVQSSRLAKCALIGDYFIGVCMVFGRWLQRISHEVGRRKAKRLDEVFAPLDHKAVFNRIYGTGVWGKKAGEEFFSGPGSHDDSLVGPYVESVKRFLATIGAAPSVVDLGCGDFNVGQYIRPYCGRYVACDVVPGLIAHNARKFASLNVDFQCVDMVDEALPTGQVIILRQVLQHLSNAMIARVLDKVQASCDYLILTEDIPLHEGFVPNADKPTGPGTRTQFGSGVVPEARPFNFECQSHEAICELTLENSRLRTVVYNFK